MQIMRLGICLMALTGAFLVSSSVAVEKREIQEDFIDFQDYDFGDYDYYVPYTDFSEYSSFSEEGDLETPSTSGPGASKADAGTPAPEVKTEVKTVVKPVSKSKRSKKDKFANKVVEFAPSANITFGDDIDDEGKCEAEIEKYCEDVEEGEGNLADCMSDHIAQSESYDEDKPDISDDCREEVYQFKISRNANINRNIRLAKQCKDDAEKFCNVTWFFGYKQGQIISCLRDVKDQVKKKCKNQIFKVMMDAASDIRADPILYEACKDDVASLCKDVKNGGGRVQGCLRDKRMQISWPCEEQLYRQEIEDSDDIRLSVRLYGNCMADKRKFCKDIEPGNAAVKDCLEENREDLSAACKPEIDDMIERRVRDFRLDSKLRSACDSEIFNLCAYFGDLDDIDMYDSSVINCLQDYTPEIKNKKCLEQVNKYIKHAAEDIRFDVPLAEACYEDRQKYCSNVAPGSARVIRCLSSKRNSLSPLCRATLFDEEVRFSENIDFQFPMKAACTSEMNSFCKGIPHGNARVIRCLQNNKDAKGFGSPCKVEIQSYENEMSKDYRLNFRLNSACQKDVKALCPSVCQMSDAGIPDQVCGGKVLRCLTDKLEDITDEACKQEVNYFEKMEVSNFRNDIILAEACRDDVENYCATVEAGEGRVHKCLRDNRKKLSESCRKEEMLLEEKENDSVELSVGLLKACKSERQLFCKGVQPGSARVFRCMAENMNDPDFGNTCKSMIRSKLERRQSNWKLDPPLRKACRSDVAKYCASQDVQNAETGVVYQCMIDSYSSLNGGCQRELGRAVHMAFFIWRDSTENILTSRCDADIKNICLTKRPNMANTLGAVGECLGNVAARMSANPARLLLEDDVEEEEDEAAGGVGSTGRKRLSDLCYTLTEIAEPPNQKKSFDSSLSFALLKDQLDKIDSTTGIPMVRRDRAGNARGISLTGWMATLGMAALVVVIAYGSFLLYKRLKGETNGDYTMVVKSQPK
eukprot:gene10489-8455_t